MPFRVTFDIVSQLRASKNPPCLTDVVKDEYIAGNTQNWFKEYKLHGFSRVYSALSHFRPVQNPATLRALSIGPRTEVELYYLCVFFGFSWENVTGLDLVAPTPKIVLGDISLKIPFPDNSFDVIVASHCLEKSRDPVKTRDEILRIAKPGARAIVCGNTSVIARPGEKIYTIHPFQDGVYGFIKHYGLDLGAIEFMNARSDSGFEIIFRIDK